MNIAICDLQNFKNSKSVYRAISNVWLRSCNIRCSVSVSSHQCWTGGNYDIGGHSPLSNGSSINVLERHPFQELTTFKSITSSKHLVFSSHISYLLQVKCLQDEIRLILAGLLTKYVSRECACGDEIQNSRQRRRAPGLLFAPAYLPYENSIRATLSFSSAKHSWQNILGHSLWTSSLAS